MRNGLEGQMMADTDTAADRYRCSLPAQEWHGGNESTTVQIYTAAEMPQIYQKGVDYCNRIVREVVRTLVEEWPDVQEAIWSAVTCRHF